MKWKPAASSQRCHKVALNFRSGTQSVVHVGHVQGQSPGRRQLPQNMQQADTVGPAADRYHHREWAVSLQVKQSMLCLGMDNGRQQRIGYSGRGISVHGTIIACAA